MWTQKQSREVLRFYSKASHYKALPINCYFQLRLRWSKKLNVEYNAAYKWLVWPWTAKWYEQLLFCLLGESCAFLVQYKQIRPHGHSPSGEVAGKFYTSTQKVLFFFFCLSSTKHRRLLQFFLCYFPLKWIKAVQLLYSDNAQTILISLSDICKCQCMKAWNNTFASGIFFSIHQLTF